MKKPFLYRIFFLYALIFIGGCINLLYGQCVGGVLTATDSLLCVNQSTTLSLSGYNGSITWQRRPFGNPTWSTVPDYDSELTATFAGAGQWEYRAIVQIDACAESSNILNLKISNFSGIPNPGIGGSICGNDFALDAVDMTGFWEQVSGPGTAIFSPSANIRNPDVTVDSNGIYGLAWNISDGICTKDSIITIESIKQPIANAGSNFSQCGKIFNLNAEYSTATSTGLWTRVSGPLATINNPTNPKTLINSNTGNLIMRWRETNNGCIDESTVAITVISQPTASAGPDANECDLESRLSANPDFPGKWTLLSGPSDTIFLTPDGNSDTATATANTYGTYELQWITTNNICADTDAVVINYYEQPVASPYLINDTCGTGTILRAGTSASTGSNVLRSWTYLGSLNPNLNKINDSTTSAIITEPNYGTYTFRWKEQNAVCADSEDVTLSFFEIPEPFAGADAENCGNSYALSAVKSIIGSQSNWRALDNPANISFSNAAEAKTTVTATVYNPYRLIFTETNNTICSTSDTLEIDFIEIPQANAGINADTCGYIYPLVAKQSIPGSSGEWFLVGSTDTTSLVKGFNTIASVTNDSTYAYMFTETNKFCADSASKLVSYHKQVMAEVLESEDACGLEQTVLVKPVTNETAEWTINPGGGQNSVLPGTQPGEYRVSVKSYNSYLLNYLVSNSHCSDDTSITIKFYEIPETKTGSDKAICGDQGILSQQVKPGTAYWDYRGPGTAVFDPINDLVTRVNVSKFGNYTFMLTGTNEICMSTDTVIYSFVKIPASDAGNNDEVCGDSTTLNAQPQTGSWLIVSGPGKVDFSPNNTAANAEMNVSEFGRYELQWIASNEACSDTSTLLLSFQNKPLANAGKNQNLINQFETVMQANAPATGESAEWTLLSGNAQVSSITNPTASVSIAELGEHVFLWTVQNDAFAACNTSDSVFIVVDDILIPQIITPNGDGENDYFFITGIEDVSPVELSIMNRWGTEVFASSNYLNDWDGAGSNGEYLTNDTYFYILKIPNRDIFKGFVVLKR